MVNLEEYANMTAKKVVGPDGKIDFTKLTEKDRAILGGLAIIGEGGEIVGWRVSGGAIKVKASKRIPKNDQ